METHRYLEMLTPFFYPKLKSIDIHTCIVFKILIFMRKWILFVSRRGGFNLDLTLNKGLHAPPEF